MPRRPLGSQKKDNKTLANKREKEQAKKIGGVRVPLSGALSGRKGDIEVGEFLLDSKYSCQKAITLSSKQMAKIAKEAREQNRRPGLLIELANPPFGTPAMWVLMPQVDFEELTK